MFSKKKDLDAYVSDIFKKSKSEKERNSKCLTIAKQYAQLQEWATARRYVGAYIQDHPNSAPAMRLQGDCEENLGNMEKALNSYRSSLTGDPTQKDLIFKVCELLCKVSVDTETYQYWADRAESLESTHPSVFKLKEHILTSISSSSSISFVPQELEALIMAEQKARPEDPSPNCRLLKLYTGKGQHSKAYKLAVELEAKSPFRNDIMWYETLTQSLEECKKSVENNWEFHSFLLLALERLLSLCIDNVFDHSKQNNLVHNNLSTVIDTTFKLDQALFSAQTIDKPGLTSRRALAEHLMQHLVAQLAFHLACILFKKAKRDPAQWKSAKKFSGPLLMLAYQTQIPDEDLSWFKDLPNSLQNSTKLWMNDGRLRKSQAGNILLGLNRKKKFLDVISPLLVTKWQEKLYEDIFVEYPRSSLTSYLAMKMDTNKLNRSLPTSNELGPFDEASTLSYFDQLPLLVWYGLQFRAQGHPWTPLNEMNDDPNLVALNVLPAKSLCAAFPSLKRFNKDLPGINQPTPESLSQMDIDAFIFASVACSASVLEGNQIRWSDEKPEVLPICLSEELCTSPQKLWWTNVCRILKPSAGHFSVSSETRKIIRNGLEAIRSVDSQSGQQDVRLLCALARYFTAQAIKNEKCGADDDLVAALYLRASHYWSCAKPALENIKSGRALRQLHPDRLFALIGKELDRFGADSLLYEACFAAGAQLVKNGRFEEAIEAFGDLSSPYASMEQALLYKRMGEAEDVDMPTKKIYFKRALGSFYLTLDRLKGQRVDPRHPLNNSLRLYIEETEEQINVLFPDAHIRNQVRRGDHSYSDVSDEEDNPRTPAPRAHHSTPFTSSRARPVTLSNGTPANGSQRSHNYYRSPAVLTPRPREEARPSPERLEAQMRQLSVQREGELQAMARIVEATRSSDNGLRTELQYFKDAVSKDLQANQREMMELRKETEELNKNFQSVQNDLQKVLKLLKTTHITNISPAVSESRNIPDEDHHYYGEEIENEYGNESSAINLSQVPHQKSFPTAAAAGNTAGNFPMYNRAVFPFPPPNYFPLAGGVDTTALMYQNLPFLAPGALPFSEGQRLPEFQVGAPNLLPGQLPVSATAAQNAAIYSQLVQPPVQLAMVNKVPPVAPTAQIVSDPTAPVATKTPEKTPLLSLPHAFQITMPAEAQIPTASPLDKAPALADVSPQMILQNVPTPAYSSVTPEASKHTPRISRVSVGSVVSEDGEVPEHDAIPDFKPIIPLPDEVAPNTGEEEENVLFENRAKLYRFVDGEWKERGTGLMKILESMETSKVRILMRRDQVLKVCCNHFIPSDIVLSHISGNDKTWSWAAQDFADETVRVEKFGVRFKTVEEANLFKDTIDKVKAKLPKTPVSKLVDSSPTLIASSKSPVSKPPLIAETPKSSISAKSNAPASTVSFGGFTFTSAPSLAKKADEDRVDVSKKEETASKPSPFAGFSFGTPSSTPSIFGSFGGQKSETFGGVSALQSSEKNEKSTPLLGTTSVFENSPVSQLSFASMSQQQPSTFSSSAGNFKGFDGAGTLVFGGSTPSKSTTAVESTGSVSSSAVCPGDAESAEDFIPTADFKPVIPLPELVEVKTGEEGEDVLFENRAKLLRFVLETKEWKERGIGKMKMTWNPSTCKVRLVMRREQVLKVCCNHFLTREMKLLPISSSDRSWTWVAQDYSEGNLSQETLAIKFKNPEEASAFKEKWQEIQKDMTDGDKLLRGQAPPAQTPATSVTPLTADKDLMKQFKKPEGSWECKDCYISNKADVTKCVACQTSKPGSETPKSNQTTTPAAGGSLMSQFKKPEGSWDCKACYINNKSDVNICVACETARPGFEGTKPTKNLTPGLTFDFKSSGSSKFSFGNAAAAGPVVTSSSTSTFNFGNPSSTSTSKPAFAFGVSQPAFSFGTPKITEPSSTTTSFGFKLPATPAQITTISTSAVSPGDAEESDGEVENDEGDHIHFTPIIPLPEMVNVVTGEEDEEPLYSHRAKLFRWANGEWKERGIGDLKILRHKQNGSIRLLMRRDQVLKICLNHRLTNEMEFSPKGDKNRSFQWHASDFSEGEVRQEQFAVLFKTEDIAKDFIEHVEEAKSLLGDHDSLAAQSETAAKTMSPNANNSILESSLASNNQSTTPSKSFSFGQDNNSSASGTPKFTLAPSSFSFGAPSKDFTQKTSTADPSVASDDEVKILDVINVHVSPEDVNKARALQLPDNFYSYKQKTPCKGCKGCQDEESDSSSASVKEESSAQAAKPVAVFGQSATVGFSEKSIKPALNGSSINIFSPSTDQPTFASLAQSNTSSGFGNAASSKPFSWGTGAPLFGSSPAPVFGGGNTKPVALFQSPATASPKTDKDGHSSGEEEEEEEAHDPHFEPIIDLPDIIDVRTGEEDEEKIFAQRAKLYRYDTSTKEWKERGVGEMKLLYHQATGRYRLLLRREQVYKVVLNQLLTKDLELKKMATSNNAVCWGGFNHAEESGGKTEELAVRFKNEDLLNEFKSKVEEAKERLSTMAPSTPPQADRHGPRTPPVHYEESDEEEQEEEEEGEDEEDEDDYETYDDYEENDLTDEQATVFSRKDGDPFGPWLALGVGRVKIAYCSDGLYSVIIELDVSEGSESVRIPVDSRMQAFSERTQDKEICFSGMNQAQDTDRVEYYKVLFQSSSAADDFQAHFSEGLVMADNLQQENDVEP
ncbi:E3 SUMO-protein ligase RanBP2-like isoform X2 [Cloeon dipterum]|uniref:E3 SUMO-protein ligase RanBP2-like isoform X2 n=1 Tax=Cloeon dipterum TaxID=197152 RepID=UPI00322042E5